MQPAKYLLNRTARVLTLSLGLATLVPTVGFSQSDLAKREMMRRSEKVRQAEELLGSGREAYQSGDYQSAVTSYNEALGVLPGGFATAERRRVLEAHLADATVALSQQFRRTGKYAEAREKLNQVLSIDPNNQRARQEIEYLDDPIRTNPALNYDHTTNVDKVRRFLYTAEGFKNLGLFDDAIREYQKALQVDEYNSAARRGMEGIHQLKSDHYRTAFDEARSRMLAEVDAAWEMAVPPPIELDGSVVGGLRPSPVGVNIEFKLKNMIIPVVDFDDTTVEEAIDFLRQRAAELDKWELDPVKKGINFVIRKPRIGGGAPDAELDVEGGLGAIDPGSARVKELKLRNVPLSSVLQYICEQARLRFKVDDFAVTLLPIGSAEGEDVLTRKWKVPPTFLNDIGTGGDGDGAADADPFAADDEGLGNRSLAPRRPLKEILQDAGIEFPPGSSAQYIPSTSTLIVSNTPQNLDLVDQLVEDILGGSPKMIRIVTKFVEVAQENSDELSFDWIVTPFGLGGVVSEELFAGGGTQGNGQVRTGADFISPLAFTNIPGIPAASNQAVQNIVTASNRSGDTAVTRNSIDAVLNNPNRSAQVNRPAPGILSLTGLFNSGQLQMIMRGLAQKKGTDIMTAPSVTARPGQKATIEIIREFIYPTEYEPPELPNQVGGGFGNQGGGGLIGGGGGAGGFPVTPATPTAFETRNTGVTLEIEPNLGPNEYVIDLRFAPEIVEFEGFINYGSPITSPATDAFGNPVTVTITENRIEMPVFSSRRVSTGITIYDGHTVAVGGLMREDVQDVEDGVPILSDIPLIGRLFKSDAQSNIKSNLIIFVTANIIDASGKDYRKPNEVDPSGTPVDPVSTDLGGGPEGILPPL